MASTTSLLAKVLVVQVLPVAVMMPFFRHWIRGEAPPLVTLAVKVTGIPAHTGAAETPMVISGANTGLTVMMTALLAADCGLAQALELGITKLTEAGSDR